MRDRFILAAGGASALAFVAAVMIVPAFLYSVAAHNVTDSLVFGLLGVLVSLAGTGLALLFIHLLTAEC